ncbi:NAD-dependent epimerase/dehydratase family protein [Streptomyces bohaiensis]|uniref:NAD(P)-dependent oxidoreductase n=1 Tax=Streptomyces bohaiensis TaxID=1431344 RepID=A0ABX1C8F7_9ACTN|nr:NAD(P)-dependent oxidoreductase [Streptomyces bohaiensis]NJQ15434.1 NAD(P)-dependent oxidoreductase [Streptomyces bohaiensis]
MSEQRAARPESQRTAASPRAPEVRPGDGAPAPAAAGQQGGARAGTVLLTGAAGRLGTALRAGLPASGWELRCLDRVAVPGEPDAVVAELGDEAALRAAVRGVDAVVHLAGHPGERDFPELVRNNILGSYHLYEAVRREGVPRVVAASSNHAVGFARCPDSGQPPIPVDGPHRPDTFYGLTKCVGEDLAELYWARTGIETVSLRIGACYQQPRNARELSIWLSHGDLVRLVHAALTAPHVGHTVVNGVSANTRGVLDLTGARRLGYRPADDAEEYAGAVLAADEPGWARPGTPPLGGDFIGMWGDWPPLPGRG